MSNIPEETGKVATSAIEAFRNNPACLAAILLAAMMAVLTFFAMQADAKRKTALTETLLERCYPLQDRSLAHRDGEQ